MNVTASLVKGTTGGLKPSVTPSSDVNINGYANETALLWGWGNALNTALKKQMKDTYPLVAT